MHYSRKSSLSTNSPPRSMAFASDLPIAAPIECLAFVAVSTTTILIGAGVLLPSFHHPAGLAKKPGQDRRALQRSHAPAHDRGQPTLPARPPPSPSITRPEVLEDTRWARSIWNTAAGRPTPPRASTASSSARPQPISRTNSASSRPSPPFTAGDAERRRGATEQQRHRPGPGFTNRRWITHARPMPARRRPWPIHADQSWRTSQQTNVLPSR